MILHKFFGRDEHANREATMYVLTEGDYAVQAWDGTTTIRLGEYDVEQDAEFAAENYVQGRNPQWGK